MKRSILTKVAGCCLPWCIGLWNVAGQEEDPFASPGRSGRSPADPADELFDPFNPDARPWPKPEPETGGPPGVVVQTRVEFFEVTQARYTALMAAAGSNPDDGALRRKLLGMAGKGEAALVETMVCNARDRQKGKTESFTEHIYCTEYEPPEMANEAAPEALDRATGPHPSAWDTRCLGPMLEVEPNFDDETGAVELLLLAEVDRHVGDFRWIEWHGKWGDCHALMPVFYTLRCDLDLTVMPGQPLLAAALTPKDPDGMPDPARKLMVFVTCQLPEAGE